MTRYAAKVDDNQAEIVAALRKAKYQVVIMNRLPAGFPDLIVCRAGHAHFLEVKAEKVGRLTTAQVGFHQAWTGEPIKVVRNIDEALEAIRASG